MKILFLTNEYPPYIYGGAGVHVEKISRALSRLCPVEVRCFGDQSITDANLCVKGYQNTIQNFTAPKHLHRVFDAVERCLNFNSDNINADVVHAHTWYTHLGGILAKINYSLPLVITVHSLEPLRPWKREQLGGGYDFSCWIEKTAIQMADAVIAVSQDTKKDILKLFNVPDKKVHVIPNGIDPQECRPTSAPDKLKRFGIDPGKPFVLFVGRITRQKGILHLVNAIPHMDKNFQIVLCASSPDTPQIAREMDAQIAKAKKAHPNLIWIQEMLDTPTKTALYSHAGVFCCPSVYEPFGIINLEAMACETAVVAAAVGGIKEVVEHEKTGFLVPLKFKKGSLEEPEDPKAFSLALAEKINHVMADNALQEKMGRLGRKRVLKYFTWKKVAQKTFEIYSRLTTKK